MLRWRQEATSPFDHSHSCPADILVLNWSVGKPAAFDLSVTSQLNLNVVLEAGLTAGATARATELRKHEANDGKCRESVSPWLLKLMGLGVLKPWSHCRVWPLA